MHELWIARFPVDYRTSSQSLVQIRSSSWVRFCTVNWLSLKFQYVVMLMMTANKCQSPTSETPRLIVLSRLRPWWHHRVQHCDDSCYYASCVRDEKTQVFSIGELAALALGTRAIWDTRIIVIYILLDCIVLDLLHLILPHLVMLILILILIQWNGTATIL